MKRESGKQQNPPRSADGNAPAHPVEEWQAPEIREFDILESTLAGASGTVDAGLLS